MSINMKMVFSEAALIFCSHGFLLSDKVVRVTVAVCFTVNIR